MTNKLPDPIRTARSGVNSTGTLTKIKSQSEEPYDFEYWGKMATWTLPQAHSLCSGTSPFHPKNISSHDKLINSISERKEPILQNMVQLWLLMKNAYDAFELHNPVKPIKFIQWADIHGVLIPKELRDSVEDIEQKKSGQKQQGVSSIAIAEIEYIPPYVNFMLKAAKALNLSPDNRTNLDEVICWLDENWPVDLDGKSERMIKSMATFLRRPEDKKGGNIPWK